MSRRRVLIGGGLVGMAAVVGAGVYEAVAGGGPARRAAQPYRWKVFSSHQASVVEEATARLIPGPLDDPAEAGHPGAREAGVVYYIDGMLGALSGAVARVFAGGPFSARNGAGPDDMSRFLSLTPVQRRAWAERVATLRRQYAAGVAALDAGAGGDFTAQTPERGDVILTTDPDGFTTLLFGHAIEGMYSVPEYGGNRGLVGWRDIGFPGDSQPRGYRPDEVDAPGIPDQYSPTGVEAALLNLLRASSGV